MIRYVINAEEKTIELQSSGTLEELRDLCELFKDYKFTLAIQTTQRQGMLVGGGYVPIIGQIEHS